MLNENKIQIENNDIDTLNEGRFINDNIFLLGTSMVADRVIRKENKNIAEGPRGPFYTIGRSYLPTADTLRRRRRKHTNTQNVSPKAQHRFCTMV